MPVFRKRDCSDETCLDEAKYYFRDANTGNYEYRCLPHLILDLLQDTLTEDDVATLTKY